jgi:hypothetical protein
MYSELPMISGSTQAGSINVVVSGTDVNGKACEQQLTAYDLTQTGARLDGSVHSIAPGTRVTVQYENAAAGAQVVWVATDAKGICQVGIRLLDPRRCPWKSRLAESDGLARLPDRRRADRYKTGIGVQLSDERFGAPMQTTTVDIGVGGCYVETLFPPPVGLRMQVVLWLGSTKLLAKGVVRTSYPGVGMGIEFIDLSWEETERLYRFLESSPVSLDERS